MILPPELQYHLHQALAELDRSDRQLKRDDETRKCRSERTAPAGFIFLDRAAHFIAGDGVPGDGLEQPDSVDKPRQRKFRPWRDALLRDVLAGKLSSFDQQSTAPTAPESASEDSLLRIDDLNRWIEKWHSGALRLAIDEAGAEPLAELMVSDDTQAAVTPQLVQMVTAAIRGMPTDELATAFDGLGWDRAGWRSTLNRGNHELWLKACKVSDGVRGNGGKQARWNPVSIAAALVKGRNSGGTNGSRKLGKPTYKDICKAFSTRRQLQQFSDEWKREREDLDPYYGDD
jgi:hypothetical protein